MNLSRFCVIFNIREEFLPLSFLPGTSAPHPLYIQFHTTSFLLSVALCFSSSIYGVVSVSKWRPVSTDGFNVKKTDKMPDNRREGI